MKAPRPLADVRLTALLRALLAEELLPPLDRWFSRQAKDLRWPVVVQRELWNALRRALARGYALCDASTPATSSWTGFRVALRGRETEWALRSDQTIAEETLSTAGIPGWLAPQFQDRVRRSSWTALQTQAFLAAQDRPAPVHVRFRAGPEGEACARRLIDAGSAEVSDVEGILRLSGGAGLESGEDFRRGLVEIQDGASQLSLGRLGLRPGQRVWDVCAGQGGKTLLAARELRGKGALLATDIVESKLKVLKERVKRSGWQNIRLQSWTGEVLPEFGPEMARGGFDRVIVDAPCSASGTWRRDPDGRFRLVPRALTELNKHQARLLRLGWSALKVGGRLAYVTCSWLPSEDELIVADFVAQNGAVLAHEELLGLPLFDANTVYVAVLEKHS